MSAPTLHVNTDEASHDVTLDGSVNQHYLEKVINLAEVMPVVATEDIYDSRGMKLLAKGAVVSRALQEKIILHKLKKPIESSLAVEGGVDSRTLVDSGKRLIETCLPLAAILRAVCIGGFTPLTTLGNMSFGNAMTMMLTISGKDGSGGFDHALTVSMLSICWSRRLHMTEQEQKIAGLAGLLHDVGELYIDPSYQSRGNRLQPHEWRHLAVHPRIGEMLISASDSFPPGVSRAVGEHHERYDGGGYPRHLRGKEISVVGQIVAMAELIAGMLRAPRSLERAELAIRIFPGEYEHGLLSTISGSLQLARQAAEQLGENPGQAIVNDAGESLDDLYARIINAATCAKQLLSEAAGKSPAANELLIQAIDRIGQIQRAFVSTGMDAYLAQSSFCSDGEDDTISFEKEVAIREIKWRLRGVARDIALRFEAKDENTILSPLIQLLDGQVEVGV